MSRSSIFFIAAIFAMTGIAYLLPGPNQLNQADLPEQSNQAAARYLLLKKADQFNFESYSKECDTIMKIAPDPGTVKLTRDFVGFLEGESSKNPVKLNATQTNEHLLAFVTGQEAEFPTNIDGLNMQSWVDLALLQKAYEKAGKSRLAAQTEVELLMLESRLSNQLRLGVYMEVFSLVGMALLIQFFFQWRAFKKLKWEMFKLDPIPVPMKNLAYFFLVFFFSYMFLTLALSALGATAWVMAVGYLLAILLGWFLLRRFLFLTNSDILEKSGFSKLRMTVQSGLYAVFGFCILVFLCSLTLLVLQAVHWPFNTDISDVAYKQMLAEPLSAMIMVLISCIIAPVAEELLFRGILLKALSSHLPQSHALLWSALLFAVLHPISFFPLVLILGLCLGLIYMRTKNLMAPIMAHMLWNVFTLIQIQLGT